MANGVYMNPADYMVLLLYRKKTEYPQPRDTILSVRKLIETKWRRQAYDPEVLHKRRKDAYLWWEIELSEKERAELAEAYEATDTEYFAWLEAEAIG